MSILKRVILHILQILAYVGAYLGTIGAGVVEKSDGSTLLDVYFNLFCFVLLPVAAFYVLLWLLSKGSYSHWLDVIGLCASLFPVSVFLLFGDIADEDLKYLVIWLLILMPSLVMTICRKRKFRRA